MKDGYWNYLVMHDGAPGEKRYGQSPCYTREAAIEAAYECLLYNRTPKGPMSPTAIPPPGPPGRKLSVLERLAALTTNDRRIPTP